MSLKEFLFYALSAVILLFSLFTVNSRRMLRAATWLLFVLVATGGLFMLMTYQFMAAIQLSVYAGGIMVLIIFSIFLTSHINHKFERPGIRRVLSGGFIAVAGAIISIVAILNYDFAPVETMEVMEASTENIGRQLVSTGRNGYALIFEAINVLLLAALIGGIVIARKEKRDEK